MAMGQHGRSQTRIMCTPACLSRLPLFCGSVLVLLALVSLITGPFLDLDSFPARHQPSSELEAVKRHSEPAKVIQKRDVLAVSKSSSGSIWISKSAANYYGCSSPTKSFPRHTFKSQSNGFLLIEASGGLNQQRTGIIDAVVAARILNATLVVPHLDHKSFWKDSSNFSDIFDVDWFITALEPDVPIIKELPTSSKIPKGRPYSTRVPRKCTPEYYRNRVLPVLRKKKVMRLTKFDYRLSNRLDEDLQKLRCRVNYNALRFTMPIQAMGNMLVDRLRERSGGRYIALHLRFEPDMLAFSGCYYGGGEKEIRELGLLRKRWKTIHKRSPEKERRNGKCPLTPEEVGFMLRALGFHRDSFIYVASGEVYGGMDTLAPLKKMFPNFFTKDSLVTKQELLPFMPFSSRMAALDYIVCDESDVFIANNNGNMARILGGRRRYFGHKRTIRPNLKKLGSLFLAKPNMTWDAFASKLRRVQKGFMGDPSESRPGRGQFFENPYACICRHSKVNESLRHNAEETNGVQVDGQVEEPDPADPEDEEDIDSEDSFVNLEDKVLNQQSDTGKEDYGLDGIEDPEQDDATWLSD